MTDKSPSYLEERWQSQKDFFSKNSAKNKRFYERLQLFVMVVSAGIPLVVVFSVHEYIPAVLGFSITVATGFEKIYKYGDHWQRYRLTTEALKREKALYQAGAGPYRRTETPDLLFAERCENIIATEVGSHFTDSDDQKKRS